jgi:hypothetical protein
MSRISDLETRVLALERRLAALEGVDPETVQVETAAADGPAGDGVAAAASTHIGRVLLIFGGAYLLRAITEYEFVPIAIGLIMGASYALVWLGMAWRTAPVEGQRIKAEFFAGTSVVLCLPLLHEATTQFPLLSGTQGVIAIGIFWVLAMLVAVRHHLTILAWMSTAGSIVAAFASLLASQTAFSVAVFLLLVGLGTTWIARWQKWTGLCWLGAAGANVVVIALIALSTTDRWPISPDVAFLFAVALLVLYLLSFTWFTHVKGLVVTAFQCVQTLLVACIVLAAALVAVRAGQVAMNTVGFMGVIVGAGGYGLAVARETRTLRYPNFFYYSTFGLVFLLVGTGILAPLDLASIVWALLAIVMAYLSARTGWVSLSLQCTILLVAASAGSGLLAAGLEAFAGDPSNGWVSVTGAHVLVSTATVACLFIPVAQHSDRWGGLAGLPQLIVLALSVWSVGGVFVAIAAQEVADAGGSAPGLAALAALRTAVLAMAAVILALSSRQARWPEARWLVYPVLIVVCIKLFIEDFPHGEPAALFVALAFVGGSLLLVARLLKRADDTDKSTVGQNLERT